MNNYFNLSLDDLPNNIKKIIFEMCSKYNNELNNLPKSLEYLELNLSYNKKLLNMSSKLIVLVCSEKYRYQNDYINKCKIEFL